MSHAKFAPARELARQTGQSVRTIQRLAAAGDMGKGAAQLTDKGWRFLITPALENWVKLRKETARKYVLKRRGAQAHLLGGSIAAESDPLIAPNNRVAIARSIGCHPRTISRKAHLIPGAYRNAAGHWEFNPDLPQYKAWLRAAKSKSIKRKMAMKRPSGVVDDPEDYYDHEIQIIEIGKWLQNYIAARPLSGWTVDELNSLLDLIDENVGVARGAVADELERRDAATASSTPRHPSASPAPGNS